MKKRQKRRNDGRAILSLLIAIAFVPGVFVSLAWAGEPCDSCWEDCVDDGGVSWSSRKTSEDTNGWYDYDMADGYTENSSNWWFYVDSGAYHFHLEGEYNYYDVYAEEDDCSGSGCENCCTSASSDASDDYDNFCDISDGYWDDWTDDYAISNWAGVKSHQKDAEYWDGMADSASTYSSCAGTCD